MDKDWYNSLPHVSWPTHCLECQQEVIGSRMGDHGLYVTIPCNHEKGTYKVKPDA